jgi:hypothetical protein
MGNIIKSCDNHFEEIQREYSKTCANNTVFGRFSTKHLNQQYLFNKEKNKLKSLMKKRKERTEFNYIYKELFPPMETEKSRFTICHSEIPTEESKSISIDEKKYKDIGVKKKIILIQANKRHNTKVKSQYSSMSTRADSMKENKCQFLLDKGEDEKIRINTVKSGEELRRSYIAKLISKNVWQPTSKEKDHNTIFIFDWDDTLLCTSYLAPLGIYDENKVITEDDSYKIRKLESSVVKLLKLAISKGQTFIITNAAPGWVEYSAKKYYPCLMKILPHVTILSARAEYGKIYPGNSRQWKILAFLQILEEINTNLVTNLICIGDSIIEMEAAHILASHFKQAYIKTLKFKSIPTVDELYNQIKLAIEQFHKIYSSVKNMNVKVIQKSDCDS